MKRFAWVLMTALITILSMTGQAQEGENVPDRPLLMTHYMPWYQTPRVSGSWGWHWTMGTFSPSQTDENGRPEIASHFMPLTGPYDSRDDAVLEYQVLLMKLSGIDGVIVDWYGSSTLYDYDENNAAAGKLFEVIERAGLRFIICYEDRTIQPLIDNGRITLETAVEQGQRDIRYANDQWFSSDAYVRYNDQPLLFIFGPLYFRQADHWTTIFDGLDTLPGLVTYDRRLEFAAVASYPWPPMHLSGGIELPPSVLESYLELFYRNAERRDLIIGSAFPGFHDIYAEAGVQSSFGYIDPRNGETLRTTLDAALAHDPFIVQLVTWNDYGEGTMIEPTEEYGYQYLEIMQETRTALDPEFAGTPDDLRLPMRLYEARRAYTRNDAVNAELDRVFDAIIGGDLAEAQAILDALPPQS